MVFATHSDQTLAMLAEPTAEERTVLSAVRYLPNTVVLHRDLSLMPRRRSVWASWNYLRDADDLGRSPVSVTYWMNKLQNIDLACPLFVTLNPLREPDERLVFGRYTYEHPQFDSAAIAAQRQLPGLQGRNRSWFCGAWTGYGFHEDGLRSGLASPRRSAG